MSHDNGGSFNRRIILTQAYNPRHDLVRQTDVHQDYVVIIIVNDAIDEGNQFRMFLHTEAALKYR